MIVGRGGGGRVGKKRRGFEESLRRYGEKNVAFGDTLHPHGPHSGTHTHQQTMKPKASRRSLGQEPASRSTRSRGEWG